MSITAMKQALGALEDPIAFAKGHAAKAALRTAIEQAEKQEPVAWQATADKCQIQTVPAKGGLLPTAPPQRQPLTEEEIVQVLGNVRESVSGGVFLAFARAIEAKLKEKNT